MTSRARWIPIAMGWLAVAACGPKEVAPAETPEAVHASRFEPSPRWKEKGCVTQGPRPDSACTPGAVMTRDLAVICSQPTRERRKVTTAVRRQAFIAYGLVYVQPEGAFELDHLIPLALGGDNTIANLWPEAADPHPGFHQKDAVEDYLHQQVCAGAMDLADAQRAIATDWMAVYHEIEGPLLAPREDRDGD